MEYQRVSAAASFSKKLSNGHSFSGNGIYDGIFGGQSRVGSRVEDYSEIFCGSGSSIPVLDVPELNEGKISVDVRRSKLDYSKIFGGFAEFDFAVSHEELLAKPKKEKKTLAKKRSHSERSCPSKVPMENEVTSPEPSHQSFDVMKEFKMSYQKTSPGSQSGPNERIHVAQLHDVAGYARLIDESTPSPMNESEKLVSPMLHETCPTINFSNGMMQVRHCRRTLSDLPPGAAAKQPSYADNEIQRKFNCIGSNVNSNLFDVYDIGLGENTLKVPPASSLLNYKGDKKCDASKFGVFRSQSSEVDANLCSPPYFEEEVDVNSVAATSAAAVKKAIEEARARINVAKELMERKKDGHQSRVKASSNGGLKAEGRKETKDTVKEKKLREKEPWETFAKADIPIQSPSGVKIQNTTKVDQVTKHSGDRDKLFVSNNMVGEMHQQNFRSSEADYGCREAIEGEEAKQEERAKKELDFPDKFESEEKKINGKSEKYVNKIEVEGSHKPEIDSKQDAEPGVSDLKESAGKMKPAEEVYEQREDERKLRFNEPVDKTEGKLEVSEGEACERKLNELEEPTVNDKDFETQGLNDNDSFHRVQDAQDCMQNEEKQLESGTGSTCLPGRDEIQTILQDVPLRKELEEGPEEACLRVNLEEEYKEAWGQEENDKEQDVCSGEDTNKSSDKIQKPETIKLRLNDLHYVEKSNSKLLDEDGLGASQEENENIFKEFDQMKETAEIQKETSELVETGSLQELIDERADDEKVKMPVEALMCQGEILGTAKDIYKQDEIGNLCDTLEPFMHEESNKGVDMHSKLLAHEENVGIIQQTGTYLECKETGGESKAKLVNDMEEKGVFDTSNLAEGIFELDEMKKQMEYADETIAFDKNGINVGTSEVSFEKSQHEYYAEESKIFCNMEKQVEELPCESEESNQDFSCQVEELACESEESNQDFSCYVEELACESEESNQGFEEAGTAIEQEENTYSSESSNDVDNSENIEAIQPPCMFEMKEETTRISHEIETSRKTEKVEDSHSASLTEKEREDKYASQKELEQEKGPQIKKDEAKEKEREREKERIAVERAIREARGRAFLEARERAERAAVERVNAEARRKEARGKSEKTSTETIDKASLEAKLKAERAAVERATAEARERALERALSEKSAFKARNQAEKFHGASRDNGTKQSVSPYDSHFKASGPSGIPKDPHASNQGVSSSSERFDCATTGESAQRCKARFERHQRTAERAAKALAEKNMRDLLAQKEQAERNRLAETLDAEVKRWSSGKEGNLRALLSTLQYILGPDSGWQPIPLTDIIATAAVKKAYRKATLFVHPDKLQQRGASIQQKYTCEKVFDLLKEAWNKFSAEER